MEAKEKAKELFDKMYQVKDEMGGYPMCFDTATQCVLIAVDELINDTDASSPFEIERINFWNEVKTELLNNLP